MLSPEGVAALFFLVGLTLGRWWWIVTPLVLTLPIVLWLATYELSDGALYGDGPIESTTFWVIDGVLTAAAGLAGVGANRILRRTLGRTRSS